MTEPEPGDPARGFGQAAIHVRMLRDRVRTNAYRRAIEQRVPGMVMVEIGTGSGILACFAALAGAERVYAVEETAILETARAIAKANGLDARITFIEGNSREIELPEPVDLVVSELIGNDPLAEGVLQAHADAAARFCRPGGSSIPGEIAVLSVGVDSDLIRRQLRLSIDDLADAKGIGACYDLDLSLLADTYEREFWSSYRAASLYVDLGPDASSTAGTILGDETAVAEFDLAAPRPPARVWEQTVPLRMQSAGAVNAIATYWRASLDEGLQLSNAPGGPRPTSWGGQMLHPVPERRVTGTEVLNARASFDLARVPTLTWTWGSDSPTHAIGDNKPGA